ncbi:MAG: hypothetical protein ACOC47_04975 [Alkalispirochaetaceae bacterium]
MPSKKKASPFPPYLLVILSILAGSLGWEVLVSLLALLGLPLELSTGPVGFDAGVLSVYMEVNPGTFIGLFLGYRAAQTLGSTGTPRKRRSPSGSRAPGSRASGSRGNATAPRATAATGGPGGSEESSGG